MTMLLDTVAVYKGHEHDFGPQRQFIACVSSLNNVATLLKCYLRRRYSLFGNSDKLLKRVINLLSDSEGSESASSHGEQQENDGEEEDEDIDVVM